MWYRTASIQDTWDAFADSLARLAKEDMDARIRGAHMPNQSYKLAEELKKRFLQRAGANKNLRSLPARNPEAYENLQQQLEIYAMLTYRSIVTQVDNDLSDAVTNNPDETLQKKQAVAQDCMIQVRKATMDLHRYMERGAKFKILDEDDSWHQRVKRLPS
jgi:hypothetical protein